MSKFDIKCPFIHKFNVVVPNFSSVDSLIVEIDYEDYMMKIKPTVIEYFNDIITIYSNENMFIDTSELLNVPIEIKDKTEIMFDYGNIHTVEGFPTNFAIKTDVKIAPKVNIIERCDDVILDTTKIEIDTTVGILVKLGELDPFTLGELDGKTLNELYYKNT